MRIKRPGDEMTKRTLEVPSQWTHESQSQCFVNCGVCVRHRSINAQKPRILRNFYHFMLRGTRGTHSCNMWPIFICRFYSIERGTQLLSMLKNQRSVLTINDMVFVGKQFSSKMYFGHQILPQIPKISSNWTKSRTVFELDSFFLV